MTDVVTCDVVNTKDKYVVFDTVGRIDIDFRTRGRVSSYQWRIDAHPAVPIQTAPDSDNGVVRIPDFRFEFQDGRQLYVRVLTLLGRPMEFTYDLRGLMEAKNDAERMCSTALKQ